MKNLLFLTAFIPFFLCADVEKNNENQQAQLEESTHENKHAQSKIKAMDFEEELAGIEEEEEFSLEDDVEEQE